MAEGTSPERETTQRAATEQPPTEQPPTEQVAMEQVATEQAATEQPATAPPLGRLLVLYSLGRIGIMVGIIALFWLVGLPQLPALFLGVLLSMPVAYVLLRPMRDRLTAAMVVRGDARRAAKERLRARLAGEEDPAAG